MRQTERLAPLETAKQKASLQSGCRAERRRPDLAVKPYQRLVPRFSHARMLCQIRHRRQESSRGGWPLPGDVGSGSALCPVLPDNPGGIPGGPRCLRTGHGEDHTHPRTGI